MRRRPLLTVVLATRNRADRLPASIGSVLGQTVDDLELIVVDHESTDETRSVIEAIAERDARVRYEWEAMGSSGPSSPRNRGLELARGEYVSFIDDDDRWSARKAERQLAALRARPELGGVSCFYQHHQETSGSIQIYRGPIGYSAPTLRWGHFSLGIFVLARRADYGDEFRFDPALVTCEDWDLWLRCALRKPIDTIPEVLYRVSFHPAQAQSSVERRAAGWKAFVAKHEQAMSRECLAYHDARLDIMRSHGLAQRFALGVRLTSGVRPAVIAILARQSLSARVARVTRDPGRSLRTLHRLVEGRL